MKKLTIPIIFLALFFIPFYNVSSAPNNIKKEYKINDEFTSPKLKIKANTFILDCKSEDINNDSIIDNILLIGYKKEGVLSHTSEEVKVVIQDGKGGKFNMYSIGQIDNGLGGRIFIGDFNGDRLPDILSILHTGNSGEVSVYSLISIDKNKSKPLFNQESFSKGLNFDVTFVDEFKVSIFSKELSKFFMLDVKKKKYSYVDCGIYHENGDLKESTKGQCSSFEELTPVDIDKDGIYELKGMQRISGFSKNDTLGFVKSVWKFNKDELELETIEIIPYSRTGSIKRIQRVVPVFK